MAKFPIVLGAAVLLLLALQATDATLCEPLSRFKIDCNTCYCSVDGRRYTCTKRFCNSEIDLNFNGFPKDEPYTSHKLDVDPNDEWDQLLNDLAINYSEADNRREEQGEEAAPKYNQEEELADFGDYLHDNTEYIGHPKHGARF